MTSVQAVWPSPCEPQESQGDFCVSVVCFLQVSALDSLFFLVEEVLEAVDAGWGGRQPGVRAALGLCGGVEVR